MAVGLDLRLEPMLRHFAMVCVRRLGLAGVHILTFQEESRCPVFAPERARQDLRLAPYVDVPERKAQNLFDEETFRRLAQRYWESETPYLGSEQRYGDLYYSFRLDELGVLIFRRFERPLEEAVLLLLRPILARLTTSCRASIDHEQLLQAITARKQAEDTIVFQLHHDELTGLPNRRMLLRHLEQELSRCRRHHHFGALLFLDLDRFKTINDTLGHSVGDTLLTVVASILLRVVRREDTVGRLGGDEFVIILTELGQDVSSAARHVTAVIDKIRATFSRPLAAGSHTLFVTPSIGIDVFPHETSSADDILRHADMAMYQAKALGRNSAVFYDDRMATELEDRLALEKELQAAITREEFELFYQPQYLASGELLGAEVLLRWRNPTRGMVSPGVFIPVAEETGMIFEVGNWMLRTACRQLRLLEERGLPSMFRKLSVNISGLQLGQNDFVDFAKGCIDASSIDPAHLGMELTESTLIKQADKTAEIMRALHSTGVRFAIDDFGTGYSSLAYINRFPIDTLKIDQAFVRGVHSHSGNRAIVETILALGRGLGLSIIAEGVETLAEFDCLRACGCEQFQGFLFSRPVPFQEFNTLVLTRANPPTQKSA
jgi:diguanylate cyclase (GGDEF)-like protein